MRVERRDAVALDRAPARATVVNVAGEPHYGRSSPADCSECRAIARRTRRSSRKFADPRPPMKAMAEPRSAAITIWSRSEEHTSELQSLMRISYAVFCLKKTKPSNVNSNTTLTTTMTTHHNVHH